MVSALLARHSLKTRITLITLAIFVIDIWSLAFYASRVLYGEMQNLLGDQQFSTVSILAAELNDDLQERIAALEKVAEKLSPAMLGDAQRLQFFLEELPVLQGMFNAGTFATGIDGTAIASTPRSVGRVGVNYIERDHIAAALKEGKSSVSPPVFG